MAFYRDAIKTTKLGGHLYFAPMINEVYDKCLVKIKMYN